MNRISVSNNDCKNCTAQIIAPGSVVLIDEKIPELLPNEILIKMEGCGICGSNLPSWQGRPWFSYPLEAGAPGHEGWGIVWDIGKNVSRFKTGDRVTSLSMHAFSTFDKADENYAVLIPEQLNSFPFPGEALGCAMNVFKRAKILSGQKVAIIGAGFLGSLLCQLITSEGANVVVISKRESSLKNAKKCGATHCFLLEELEKTVNSVNSVLGDGCDCVIEATGYQHPLNVASALVKTGGRLIIAGYHQDGIREINMQQWNWKGIDVINAHEREPQKYVQGIIEAIDALINKKIDPQILYSHLIPISKIEQGFELLENRPNGFMKALVII